jgi:hypothetical protein
MKTISIELGFACDPLVEFMPAREIFAVGEQRVRGETFPVTDALMLAI